MQYPKSKTEYRKIPTIGNTITKYIEILNLTKSKKKKQTNIGVNKNLFQSI